jgi:ABC-type uncharacterized transport system permease subunit
VARQIAIDTGVVALLAAAVRISIPVSLAALGETVLERSGIVNVGLEGMMLAGAFLGFAFATAFGSAFAGALLAGAAVSIVGLIFGIAVAKARADAIVCGVALNLIALGGTAAAMRRMYPSGATPFLAPLGSVRIPFLADLPVLGRMVFDQSPYFFAMASAALILWLALDKTGFGLRVAAAGERPEALLLAGERPDVVRVRSAALCGFFAGLGGSQLSIESAATFTEQATAGRGFVALAVVIIARRDPRLVPVVALLYGLAEAYTLRILAQGTDYSLALAELLPGLPFAITLTVYAIASLSSKRRSSLA